MFTVHRTGTEANDLILANGPTSAAFIDEAGRPVFDYDQEYLVLQGTDRIISEMPMNPIASARPVPQAIKDRLRTFTHAA